MRDLEGQKKIGQNGARLLGWAVRMGNGRWIEDWARLDFELLVFSTPRPPDAFIWRNHDHDDALRDATRMASSLGGAVAEVWQFAGGRQYRWDDAIEARRRGLIEFEQRRWLEGVARRKECLLPIIVVS